MQTPKPEIPFIPKTPVLWKVHPTRRPVGVLIPTQTINLGKDLVLGEILSFLSTQTLEWTAFPDGTLLLWSPTHQKQTNNRLAYFIGWDLACEFPHRTIYIPPCIKVKGLTTPYQTTYRTGDPL